MSAETSMPNDAELKWQSVFSRDIAELLGKAIAMAERVAQEAEILSQIACFSSSELQILHVHSFYLSDRHNNTSSKLREDFTTKADALAAMRSNSSPRDTGLSAGQYERMIESRLRQITPILEDALKTGEAAENSITSVAFERNRRLLEDIESLLGFFKTSPHNSPWMEFADCLARRDLPGAESALLLIPCRKAPQSPPNASNTGVD